MRAGRTLYAHAILEPSIPADVLAFIRRYIHRLETLEVLALLQASPSRVWTAKQVSDEMRSSPVAADAALATLLGHGLVARDKELYSFSPKSAKLAEESRRMVACYREKRSAVIAAIFSAPSPAVRSFAEAFTLKKGKSDG